MIREMIAEDTERVGEIWLEASLQAHHFVPAEFWRADHRVMVDEILPAAKGYVHLTGGVIDGFITSRDGVIFCLFVDPARQNRGIGRSLLEHVQSRSKALRLTVYAENAGARRFYERHGFRSVGSSVCRYTGRPELIMTWRPRRNR